MGDKKTGIIFDIQRFCTHDGPGIRSVVFMKGCPLRCVWCHNPESVRMKPQLQFNSNLCIDCGRCCGVGGYEDPRAEYREVLRAESADDSSALVRVCPTQGWKMIGREVDVAEVVDELELDRMYYESSGGGVTLSGGEAMMQFEFTLALLKELKVRGIHTAIETSGASTESRYRAVAEYVDLFLWDYKLTDRELHKKYVGGSLSEQMNNLKAVLSLGKKVVLGCIYLQGLHDSRHWESLVEMYHRYEGVVGVRLLPFHMLAADKYRSLGMEYPKKIKKFIPDDAALEGLTGYFKENGVNI